MSEVESPYQVFVIDNHPITAIGVQGLFFRQAHLNVCGSAGSIDDAKTHISRKAPDLILLDIALGTDSGLEFLKEMHIEKPEIPILIFSMIDELLYTERCLRAGARGFVRKTQPCRELLAAINQAIEGNVYLSPEMSQRIMNMWAVDRNREPSHGVEALSDRELAVLELIGDGLGTQKIATF